MLISTLYRAKDEQSVADLACRQLMEGAGFGLGEGLHGGVGPGRAE